MRGKKSKATPPTGATATLDDGNPRTWPVADIPVLTAHFRGRRWRIRILPGVLFVNGEQTVCHIDATDNTILIAERATYQHPLRWFLSFVPPPKPRRRGKLV